MVCSEFNNSPFTIMVRVKRIIFKTISIFFFKTRLISKRMKYIVSLFILVFVYSKVSPKYFLHVFKNRGVRRFLSSEIRIHWYVVLKCAFWFIVLFLSASVIFKILSQTAKWNILHNFVEKGISKDEEKLFQLLSKKAAVLTLFKMGLFGAAHWWGGKGTPA